MTGAKYMHCKTVADHTGSMVDAYMHCHARARTSAYSSGLTAG